MTWARCLAIAIAHAIVVVAALGPALADNVPLHQVPRPVLDAVRARFKDARIMGAERDRIVGGGFAYEIAIKHEGQSIDVVLTSDGAILAIKREITAADLPPAVARVLAEKYPGATYQEVEAVSALQGGQEVLTHYEIDVMTVQRRALDVRVSPEGRILREEKSQ